MSVRETNTICVLSTKGGAAMRIRGRYICVILAVLLVSCSGTDAVLTAVKPELTAALPDGVGLATASGYVGEPVAYQDRLVYMFMVGDESAAGSMYYQLFEYDGDFIPVSPAADRVFCGDEYAVYMNVDRSTGECEYFADSYDFDNRTELVLPDGCGINFIDGDRLYYTWGGSYYYCDISEAERAGAGAHADEYILLAADNERLLFLSRDRGGSDDCRGLMLYDRNSGGRIVGTLDDDCNMKYMTSHMSALICGEYAYLTLVGDYAGAENTRRLARVSLADGESLAFGETTIISPSVDGCELISCGIELAAGGGSVYAESSIYSTASFENRDGRVNLLYAVGADGCTVYPEIPVDSVGLVRVFGEKLIICEPNGDKLNTRIYELG